MKQCVWFHGTSNKNAKLIMASGFKEGTWLARHMEDAVEFGGPIVFSVEVTFNNTPLRWQVCCQNALLTKRILGIHKITKVRNNATARR
jgi:hypothetical protein